jgi:hypothetical protein
MIGDKYNKAFNILGRVFLPFPNVSHPGNTEQGITVQDQVEQPVRDRVQPVDDCVLRSVRIFLESFFTPVQKK